MRVFDKEIVLRIVWDDRMFGLRLDIFYVIEESIKTLGLTPQEIGGNIYASRINQERKNKLPYSSFSTFSIFFYPLV